MKTMSPLKLTLCLVLLFLGACSRPTDENGGGSRRAVIQNKGSDTLVNVAQAWAENYKDVNPNVAVAVTGGGSPSKRSASTRQVWALGP